MATIWLILAVVMLCYNVYLLHTSNDNRAFNGFFLCFWIEQVTRLATKLAGA